MSKKHTKFYDILEIDPSADAAAIKAAYRRLAMKWHPDKNQGNRAVAEEKFKAISQAYEVLSNPEKRKTYDENGEEGLQDGESSSNFRDPFSMFFDRSERGQKRTQDIRFNLPVSLKDFYNGTMKKLKVMRDVVCIDCAGRGSKVEGAVSKCDQCNGTGVQTHFRRLGPGMVQQLQAKCDKCSGMGDVIAEKNWCMACEAKKTVRQDKILEVHIDPGMKEGQTIKFREAADQAPGHETGDVVVILVDRRGPDDDDDDDEPKKDEKKGEKDEETKETEKKDEKPDKKEGKKKEWACPTCTFENPAEMPYCEMCETRKPPTPPNKKRLTRPHFRRANGVDLIMEHEITLTEALLGYEFPIRHLDDRILLISSPPQHVTNSGELIYVEKEGMPYPRNLDKGDLYIKLTVKMPTAKDFENEEVKRLLKELLPPVPSLIEEVKNDKEETTESFVARPFDPMAQRAKHQREHARARASASHDDEDDEGGHTCHTQ